MAALSRRGIDFTIRGIVTRPLASITASMMTVPSTWASCATCGSSAGSRYSLRRLERPTLLHAVACMAGRRRERRGSWVEVGGGLAGRSGLPNTSVDGSALGATTNSRAVGSAGNGSGGRRSGSRSRSRCATCRVVWLGNDRLGSCDRRSAMGSGSRPAAAGSVAGCGCAIAVRSPAIPRPLATPIASINRLSCRRSGS